MTKKIAFGHNPRERRQAATPDDWVALGGTPTNESAEPRDRGERQPTTRFTIDIPTELHARIKVFCALKRVKMREEILLLLEEHFKDSRL